MWDAIDNRTLLFATSIVAGAFAPLMLLVGSFHRTYPGFRHWSVGLAFVAAGAGIHSVRGLVSDFYPVILGNLCTFLGLILYLQGIRLFCGQKWHGRFWYSLTGVCVGVLYWYRFVQSDELVRTIVATGLEGALLYTGGVTLLRSAPRGRMLSHVFTGWVFIVTSTVMLVRMVVLPWTPGRSAVMLSNAPNTAFYMILLLGTIGIVFGFFLLTHERLVAELQKAHASLAAETSERIEAERRLADARNREAVGRLAGGVAHFFNNKLCVLKGYATMLMESSESPNGARAVLADIRDAGEQMARMTDRLLAYSRSKMLRSVDVDLAEWLSGMDGKIRGEFREGVEVRIQAAEFPAIVQVEPEELSRVLLTVARNARDAMPERGVFSVRLQSAQVGHDPAESGLDLPPGTYARLSLSDNGTGMNEETVRRVFEPFFSTKGLADAEGLNLGSAYGFVRQSGGTITVRSMPGKGTTFDVYLPLKS